MNDQTFCMFIVVYTKKYYFYYYIICPWFSNKTRSNTQPYIETVVYFFLFLLLLFKLYLSFLYSRIHTYIHRNSFRYFIHQITLLVASNFRQPGSWHLKFTIMFIFSLFERFILHFHFIIIPIFTVTQLPLFVSF